MLVVILLGLETFVMQLFHAPDYGLSASDHSPGHLVPSVAMAGTHRAWPQGLDASQASTGVRNNSAWAWPNYTTTDGGQSSGFYGLIVRGFSGHQNGVLDYRNYGGTNTPPASVVSNEGTGPIEGLTADQVKKYIRWIGDRRLIQLGLKPIYKVETNPLTWLDTMLNAVEHMNFFEGRATEYSKASTKGSWAEAFS